MCVLCYMATRSSGRITTQDKSFIASLIAKGEDNSAIEHNERFSARNIPSKTILAESEKLRNSTSEASQQKKRRLSAAKSVFFFFS